MLSWQTREAQRILDRNRAKRKIIVNNTDNPPFNGKNVCCVFDYSSSKKVYYSIPFLALKMDAAVHTGPELETKTNCQIEVELSDLAEVLADSGWRYLRGW